VQHRLSATQKPTARAVRAAVAPVRAAASSEDASSRRQALVVGVAAAAAALAPAGPAYALSGFR